MKLLFQNGIFAVVENGSTQLVADYDVNEVPNMVDNAIAILCDEGLAVYGKEGVSYIYVTEEDFSEVRDEVIELLVLMVTDYESFAKSFS